MKKKFSYYIEDRKVEKEINYIPFRYLAAVFITLLETVAVIGIVFALCHYVPYFYLAVFITEIACVITIIASDDNPDYKIPWLLFVLILPIAGFMLYFLFYSRKLKSKYIRLLNELKKQTPPYDDTEEFEQLEKRDPVAHKQAKMLCRIAETKLYNSTQTEYFPLGEDYFKRLLVDLENAQAYIFMEFFIIEEGCFWNAILDVLKKKAAAGVDVRVVYDDVGCMSTLPGNYAKSLKEYGIVGTPFSRLRGNADNEFNNRSHRKMVVIDGKIGYTGGINLADEYINEIERFGHWKDTGIRLEGRAVWEMVRLFLIDFGINMPTFPQKETDLYQVSLIEKENGYLIPFGDGPRPIYNRRVGKSAIQNLVNNATRYVYITTPYLIIDNDLCLTLENAALRGVTVKIMVPHIPDKKLIFAMTRSYYPRLTAAGVEIYEYTPGFLHAKSYLADDVYGIIGTINLDYRSLVHHFENGVWLYRTSCLTALRNDMENILSQSEQIVNEKIKTGLFQRFLCSVVRIFAPLL